MYYNRQGDAYYLRAPDHTSVLGPMSVYQLFRNFQFLNDLRVRTYDIGTLTYVNSPSTVDSRYLEVE